MADDLPFALESINENAERIAKKKKQKVEKQDRPVVTKDNANLLMPNTKVRLQLDKPEGVITGEKLGGTFRATDIRWSKEIYTIGNIILEDGQPPMYLVKKADSKFLPAAYTINQLQIVGEDIKAPDAKVVLRGDEPKQKLVEKILDKKAENRKKMLLVKWKLKRQRRCVEIGERNREKERAG